MNLQLARTKQTLSPAPNLNYKFEWVLAAIFELELVKRVVNSIGVNGGPHLR